MSHRSSQVFRFFQPSSLSTLQQTFKSYTGIALGWSLMLGTGALFFVERIPNFRRDFFSKIPFLGQHWAEYRVSEEEPTE